MCIRDSYEAEAVNGYALTAENIEYIKEKGASVYFSIDARKLTTNPVLKENKFQRIHFNFPHDGKSFKERSLPNTIREFFKSAKGIQPLYGRIHIALPKLSDPQKRRFYQSYIYGLYNAAASAGYRFIKKRKFLDNDFERYPGYFHRRTSDDKEATVASCSREYIFQLTSYNWEKISKKFPPVKYKAYGELHNCWQEIDTDDDSSDYEWSPDSHNDNLDLDESNIPLYFDHFDYLERGTNHTDEMMELYQRYYKGGDNPEVTLNTPVSYTHLTLPTNREV